MNTHQSGADTLSRPEDEKLSVTANLAYGFQHVLTMYGGIVAVPLIIGQAAGLSPAEIGLLITASLFAGGVATVLQTIGIPFFGCQLPLVQGSPFRASQRWSPSSLRARPARQACRSCWVPSSRQR